MDRLRAVLIVIFTGVIGVALFQLWSIQNNYAQERLVRERMEAFKPGMTGIGEPITEPAEATGEDVIVNQSIIDAQEQHPDIVGWLVLNGTSIDYPFVQSADNKYYLRRDINGKHAYAGTVFMDYRSAADFSDFSTGIYGHNMQNGSMFADLRRYEDEVFFEENDSGVLYLATATYALEIFAFMTVPNDDRIYRFGSADSLDRQRLHEYVKERATRYRELEPEASERLVILSTCATSREMRRVVIARLSPLKMK